MAYFWQNTGPTPEEKKYQAKRNMFLNPPVPGDNNNMYNNNRFDDNKDDRSVVSADVQWLVPHGRKKSPKGQMEKQEHDFLNSDRQVERQEYDFMGDNQITSNGVQGDYVPAPYEPRNRRLAEKPNNMDPRDMSGYRTSQVIEEQDLAKNSIHDDASSTTTSTSASSYSTMKEDAYNSHIHGKPTNYHKRPDSKKQLMNRFSLLPDIQKNKTMNISSTIFEPEPGSDGVRTPESYQMERNAHVRQLEMQNAAYDDSNPPQDETIEIIRYELMKCLPKYKYIPDEPIKLTKDQERKLRRLVSHDLGKTIPREKLEPRILEAVYLKLVQEDKFARGWCHLPELMLTLKDCNINLDQDLVRLIAARSVSGDHPACVNYEKIVSFLNLCLKQRRRSLESEDNAVPDEPPTPDGNNETTKLVKLLAHQIKESFYELELDRLVMDLKRARSDCDCLTEDDMRAISFKNHLPVSRSLLDALLARCEENRPTDYRYNWKRFAGIIQRAVPKEDNRQPPNGTWQKSDERRSLPLRLGDEITPNERHDDFFTQPHHQHDHSPRHLENYGERREFYDNQGQRPQQQRHDSPPKNNDMSPRGHQRFDQPQGGHGAPQRGGQDDMRRGFQDDTRRGGDDMRRGGDDQDEARKQQIENEIRLMQHQLRSKKESLNREQYNPWFKRFMDLANDLYKMDKDDKKTGYLPLEQVRTCSFRHNNLDRLDLDERLIDRCLDANRKGFAVDIHRYLKELCDEKTRMNPVKLN